MPTLFLLDVSLSMCRSVATVTGTQQDGGGETFKQLGACAINVMLDQLQVINKLEFVSLVSW